LPILYFVQDNEWDISAHAREFVARMLQNTQKDLKVLRCVRLTEQILLIIQHYKRSNSLIRKERRPFLIHAKVPLLNHHTSGVRKEWYRDDLEEAAKKDPLPRLRNQLLMEMIPPAEITKLEKEAIEFVRSEYEKAILAEDPKPEDLYEHIYAPTSLQKKKETVRRKENKQL